MTAHTERHDLRPARAYSVSHELLTLRPGDLITTGTPAGVSKLNDGDHLKGTIEKSARWSYTSRPRVSNQRAELAVV